MSKPKKNLEKARQIKGLGNSGLKNIFILLEKDGKAVLYGTGTTSDGWFIKIWVIAKCTKVVFATYESKRKSKEVKVCDSIMDSIQFMEKC